MSLTPQITLTATLDDYSGAAIGSANQPAYLRIALCGFGLFLPRIPGTAMVGKVCSWPQDIPYTGTQISVKLWGNDAIAPLGTYYAISVLDANKNVIQTGTYVFTGTETVDLSTLVPAFPPAYDALVLVPFSATPNFNCSLVYGPVAFDFTLAGGNVTSSTINPFPGQIVTFIISQDGTGGWAFAWPPNVENPGIVDPDPNSITTQSFVARANGNLYPIGPQTYS